MKKYIFTIGIISLLIGLAVLPMCNASTNSVILLKKENDSNEKPLPTDNEFRFFRLKINGTVTGLEKKLFGYCGQSPMKLTCKSILTEILKLERGFEIYNNDYSFTVRFVRWDKDYPYQDSETGLWHVKGTVYFWHSYYA